MGYNTPESTGLAMDSKQSYPTIPKKAQPESKQIIKAGYS